jgi:hypothetical protein
MFQNGKVLSAQRIASPSRSVTSASPRALTNTRHIEANYSTDPITSGSAFRCIKPLTVTSELPSGDGWLAGIAAVFPQRQIRLPL